MQSAAVLRRYHHAPCGPHFRTRSRSRFHGRYLRSYAVHPRRIAAPATIEASRIDRTGLAEFPRTIRTASTRTAPERRMRFAFPEPAAEQTYQRGVARLPRPGRTFRLAKLLLVAVGLEIATGRRISRAKLLSGGGRAVDVGGAPAAKPPPPVDKRPSADGRASPVTDRMHPGLLGHAGRHRGEGTTKPVVPWPF